MSVLIIDSISMTVFKLIQLVCRNTTITSLSYNKYPK